MTERRLAGKAALITGGSTGIGRAIAFRFLQEGCRVVIAGRSESKLSAAVVALSTAITGTQLLSRTCDVSREEDVQALVQWALDHLKKIDILVNNAGLNVRRRGLRELDPEDWRRILRTNLDGAFYTIKALLPHM